MAVCTAGAGRAGWSLDGSQGRADEKFRSALRRNIFAVISVLGMFGTTDSLSAAGLCGAAVSGGGFAAVVACPVAAGGNGNIDYGGAGQSPGRVAGTEPFLLLLENAAGGAERAGSV